MKKLDSIIEALLGDIRSGKLKEGDKVPSEYELADTFGVNRTTANKAVATLVARGLFERRKGRGGTYVNKVEEYPVGTIAYLIDLTSTGTFKGQLLKGAQSTAFRKKYALQYFDPRGDFDIGMEMLKNSGISGILTTGYSVITKELPFPVVHVDYKVPKGGINPHCVNSNNYEGGRQIAEAVIAAGHHNVVIYTSYTFNKHIMDRIDGIVDVLEAYGISDARKRIFSGNYLDSLQADNVITHSFERLYKGYTAVITTSDPEARRFIYAFRKMGLSVPGDISVTGFGNETEYEMTVTGVDQHPEEVGGHACERLIELIEAGGNGDIIDDEMAVSFVPGETLGVLKS